MSRFFAAGGISSEEETESSSTESENEIVPTARPQARSRFLETISDDEEDTVKRQVRSRKEARYDDLEKVTQSIKNHMKINDYTALQQDFESLQKAVNKARNIISKFGYPDFLFRTLLRMQDYYKEISENKSAIKKMDRLKAKAITITKQKLAKYNQTLETQLTAFREAHPNLSESEQSNGESDEDDLSQSESDSEAQVGTKPESGASRFLKGAASSSESDGEMGEEQRDSEGGETSDWISSEEESEDEGKPDQADTRVRGPGFYLKDTTVKAEGPTEKKTHRPVRQEKKKEVELKVTEIKKKEIVLFEKDDEIDHKTTLAKLSEVLALRGRKKLDRLEQVNILLRLRSIIEEHNLGPAMVTKITMAILSARFDSVPAAATHMDAALWASCVADYLVCLDMVYKEKVLVKPSLTEDEEVYAITEEQPQLLVQGDLVAFLELIDDELTRCLQNIDPHTTEYVSRLRDEQTLLSLAKGIQSYAETDLDSNSVCRVYIRIISHVYYKRDYVLKEIAKMNRQKEGGLEPTAEEIDPTAEMVKLCKYIYKEDQTERMRTQAILCHIYHLAIHDLWYNARDLMLMSHLQETIQHADIPVQILFNRTMVQIGLCAFRVGRISDAHSCLLEIYATNRAKELLAQGIMNQRYQEKRPEDEKLEKRRQIPFHQHINLELLECVYLTCAMLLEVPSMAASPRDSRRRVISKPLRRLMEFSNRSTFTGPPENTRDHVIAATKALMHGDWQRTRDLILGLKIWNLVPNTEAVKDMLLGKIQEEGLRTYMLSYGGIYDTISLSEAAAKFELPESKVHAIVSKMMINDELQAAWDQPTACIVMHRSAELSQVQQLSCQIAEKCNMFADANERTLEWRGGGFKDNQRGGKSGQWDSGRQGYSGPRGRGRGRGAGRGNYNQRRRGGDWRY